MPRLSAFVVLLCAALAVSASSARADGDPASDVLYTSHVFLPYPAPSGDVADALQRQVDAVWASKGSRLKIAVIANPSDLGAVPSLFNKPSEYAAFLGQELGFVYAGPLLIVMPAGFGVYDAGRPTAAERRVLDKSKVTGKTADDLTRSATSATEALLGAGVLATKDILPPQVYSSARQLIAAIRSGSGTGSSTTAAEAARQCRSSRPARASSPPSRFRCTRSTPSRPTR